ncbi:hypothetical protein ACLB1Q_20340 [Escherichia coli]
MQLPNGQHLKRLSSQFTHEQVFKIVGAVFAFELLNVEQRAAAFQVAFNGDNLSPDLPSAQRRPPARAL